MAEFVCEMCREPVQGPDVKLCPHCGYDPRSELKSQAKWRWGVGALLCFTVVGAIIGIPLVLWGFRAVAQAQNATPAVEA